MKIESEKILNDIERSISFVDNRSDVIKKLRRLSFTDFVIFLSNLPNSKYPLLSSKLPKMADKQVQRDWTGNAGFELLKQSIDFVRTAAFGYSEINKCGLDGAKVLDFGCGYGRLARLFYYFIEENNFYGVDPWSKSIEICNEDGLSKNFYLSDDLPSTLPVGSEKFDLIYAFSVFTHLSNLATTTCLNTLSNYLTDDGILLITIRPVEYWENRISDLGVKALEMQRLHDSAGFAFVPHNIDPIQGDITYGDTSITLEWLESHFPSFVVLKTDYSLHDALQTYVFLKLRN
jgi:SAM-dependent methyltransferase